MKAKKEICWKCHRKGERRIIETEHAHETIIIHKLVKGQAHDWCLLLTQYKPGHEKEEN